MGIEATAWAVAIATVIVSASTASETPPEPDSRPPQPHDQAHAARPIDWCIAHLIRRKKRPLDRRR